MDTTNEKDKENRQLSSQVIVYYRDTKPDTIWEYIHNPKGDIIRDINGNVTEKPQPYGKLYGYYVPEDKENNISRHFVENTASNLKKMSFDDFMENVVPDKDNIEIYDSIEDFLLTLI